MFLSTNTRESAEGLSMYGTLYKPLTTRAIFQQIRYR